MGFKKMHHTYLVEVGREVLETHHLVEAVEHLLGLVHRASEKFCVFDMKSVSLRVQR